jgi:hypothetical protein
LDYDVSPKNASRFLYGYIPALARDPLLCHDCSDHYAVLRADLRQ